jgi:hypothetical protein
MTAPVRTWLPVITLTIGLIVVTTAQSLNRYDEFRSGFSWDLAYYNQWFWAVTRGDGLLTVRPDSAYALEGPSVWKMNYLAPIRLVLLPIYAAFPDPRTLLVIQNVIFWCIVPAAYTLVRSESRSTGLALSAAALVPLTPLAWPLVWNDFRELQLAVPFVLWTVQGWRERSRSVTSLGIIGMLACRQEFAVIVLSLAALPPREPEPPERRRMWTLVALGTGFAWFVAFLVYLSWQVDPHAASDYLTQFTRSTPPAGSTLGRAADFLLVGLGSWSVLAMMAPRVAMLAIPWTWVLSSGHWDLRLIAMEHWHHVRYAAPMMALVLASGLVGYARLGSRVSGLPRIARAILWAVVALGLFGQGAVIQTRLAMVPRVIASAEADRLWSFIDEVGEDDSVLAAYEVTAPLSSRRRLYSYVLDVNRPPGFPRLAPDIRWAFVKTGDLPAGMFLTQGFTQIGPGPSIQVFRRDGPGATAPPGAPGR